MVLSKMSDPFQVLRWEIVKDIVAEEVSYLIDHRWDFAQHKSDFFAALTCNSFSLHHLDQIRRMMNDEKAEIAKREADKAKQSVTGGHRGGY